MLVTLDPLLATSSGAPLDVYDPLKKLIITGPLIIENEHFIIINMSALISYL